MPLLGLLRATWPSARASLPSPNDFVTQGFLFQLAFSALKFDLVFHRLEGVAGISSKLHARDGKAYLIRVFPISSVFLLLGVRLTTNLQLRAPVPLTVNIHLHAALAARRAGPTRRPLAQRQATLAAPAASTPLALAAAPTAPRRRATATRASARARASFPPWRRAAAAAAGAPTAAVSAVRRRARARRRT